MTRVARATKPRSSHDSRSRPHLRPALRRALRIGMMGALVSLLAASHAHADPFPLWEAGAGATVINFPDYRGSDEHQTYLFPIPYVVYRGDKLKIDRQKVRGLLFSTRTAELDFSMSGTVPVKSDDNGARQGMPDLDPTLEIGPSLNLFLYRGLADRMHVQLRMPTRAVIASDFKSVHFAGWLFHPHVNVDLKDVFPGPGWKLGLLAGPLFGTRAYHDYFYGVPPEFATRARPAYEGKGGYSGAQFIGALSKRYQNYWFGAFVKLDSLHGAAFESSPLVKRKYAIAGGVAVAWIFARSSETVDAWE